MADKRAYAKFDVGYLENPKVEPLLEEDRPYAVLLHAASILYSAHHLTDGVVRVRGLMRKVGGGPEDVQALYDSGLWVDLGDGTARIHDYLEHNRAASDVKRAQAAGARGAKARWGKPDADSTPPDDADPYADRIADRIGGGDANPNSQREREKEREEDSPSDADASDDGTFSEDVTRLCDTLAKLVRANGHKAKVGKAWHEACDRLMRLDGYTPQQVEWVARWATSDEFWAANIRSMPTLRDKFSILKARALAERNARPGGKTKPVGKAIRRTDNGITLDQW